jgi:hypothetical protein
MAIAMVAEQREVNHILKELLSSDGNEMFVSPSPPLPPLLSSSPPRSYLVPMGTYVKHRAEISFYEIMALTNRKKHLTIGYKASPPPPLLPPSV